MFKMKKKPTNDKSVLLHLGFESVQTKIYSLFEIELNLGFGKQQSKLWAWLPELNYVSYVIMSLDSLIKQWYKLWRDAPKMTNICLN